MKRRIIALFAAFILLLTCVIGCENVEYIDTTSVEESSQNIYEKLESELPDISGDENGDPIERTFTIVTDKKSVFYNEESTSGSVEKAVEARATFLHDKYGATLDVKQKGSSAVASELKTALESGLEYADMLCISAKETVKLQISGLLTDMNTLPDFNIESAYFDPNNAKNLATNQTLYLLPDATAQVYEDAYVMFFNRDLVNTKAGKDPETLVMQGKWTWDSFNEIARASAPDVYNKSIAELETDIFGYAAYFSEGVFPYVMWVGTGSKVINNNYKNPVALSMSVEEITDIAKVLKNIYNTKGRYPLVKNETTSAFESGRVAFLCHRLDYLYALRDGTTKGANYGILPIPKLNEAQNSYHTMVSSEARVFSVPKTVENNSEEDRRFVSAVISATCASGRETVKKAFLNHHIALYLNNNAETVMFTTILDSITFDFANTYGDAISSIRRPTTTAINDYIEFGSALNTSINNSISGFNKYCEDNFN